MQTLTSPEHAGRKAGIIDAPNTSANYLHKRFTQLGYKPEFQTFSFKAGFFKQALGHNVIAELPCNATPCGKMIVITAHYDHLGGTASSYYAGANDNASGTSALLYLAEHLKQTKRHQPITFLATDAEESGLYGAKHYVKTVTSNEIALNINLDMLAPTRKNRLYVLQSKPTPPAINTLKALPKPNFYLKIANSRYKMQRMMDNPRIDWHRASDHYAFSKEKIPYLYFGVGEDKNHHSKRDTLASIDFEKFHSVVIFINDFMTALLSTPQELTN